MLRQSQRKKKEVNYSLNKRKAPAKNFSTVGL
jgi:hypothetical protein